MVEEPNMVEFMQYIGDHGKSYASMGEFQERMARWHRADKHIKAHALTPDAEHFTAGHNKFSDWTEAEYTGMLGYKPAGRKSAHLWTNEKIAEAV